MSKVYIDLEETKKALVEQGAICEFGLYLLEQQPKVEIEPIAHSRWDCIRQSGGMDIFDYYFCCQHCGGNLPNKSFLISPAYCPYCGAKMDVTDDI